MVIWNGWLYLEDSEKTAINNQTAAHGGGTKEGIGQL